MTWSLRKLLTAESMCLTLLVHVNHPPLCQASSVWHAIGRAGMEQRMWHGIGWKVCACVRVCVFFSSFLVSGLGRLALMEELVPERPPLSERCPISPPKACLHPSFLEKTWILNHPVLKRRRRSIAIDGEGSDCVYCHLHKRCIGIVHIFFSSQGDLLG